VLLDYWQSLAGGGDGASTIGKRIADRKNSGGGFRHPPLPISDVTRPAQLVVEEEEVSEVLEVTLRILCANRAVCCRVLFLSVE
jgi:hypothetical protein